MNCRLPNINGNKNTGTRIILSDENAGVESSTKFFRNNLQTDQPVNLSLTTRKISFRLREHTPDSDHKRDRKRVSNSVIIPKKCSVEKAPQDSKLFCGAFFDVEDSLQGSSAPK